MIEPKIENMLRLYPKNIPDEDYALLLEYAGQKQALVKKEKWATLIKSVGRIICERCSMEKGLAFVEKAYKAFVCANQNAFRERMALLDELCEKYLELGDSANAHNYMDRYVFVAMAQLNFDSKYSGERCFIQRSTNEFGL